MKQLQRNPGTGYATGTLLIRLMVGFVFFTEGLQKFIYPALRGAGRFESIGFPFAHFLGYWVGTFETLCGALILVGAGPYAIDAVLARRSGDTREVGSAASN